MEEVLTLPMENLLDIHRMDLSAPTPEIVTFFSDLVHNPAPAGMEQLSSVVDRAGDFLEDIVDAPGTSVLISTHAILMKGILEYLMPESRGGWWSRYIGNCAVYRSIWHKGIFSVPEKVVDAETA